MLRWKLLGAAVALCLALSLPAFGQCYFLECSTPPVVAAPAPPPVQPAPQRTGFTLLPGTDLYGDDLLWLTDPTTVAGCGQACAENPACMAFTLNAEKRVCMLKSGLGRQVSYAAAISGIMQRPPVGGPAIPVRIKVEENTDHYGGDFRNIKDVTHTECQAACINNAACLAYTYVRLRASCWLKSTVNQSRYDPELISGIKY